MSDPRAVYCDPADIVRPQLDAKPWPKCCSVCAFLPGDPQRLGEAVGMLREDVIAGDIDFYCVHRVNRAGFHRVCASAARLTQQVRP